MDFRLTAAGKTILRYLADQPGCVDVTNLWDATNAPGPTLHQLHQAGLIARVSERPVRWAATEQGRRLAEAMGVPRAERVDLIRVPEAQETGDAARKKRAIAMLVAACEALQHREIPGVSYIGSVDEADPSYERAPEMEAIDRALRMLRGGTAAPSPSGEATKRIPVESVSETERSVEQYYDGSWGEDPYHGTS